MNVRQQYIAKSKYSRFLDHEGRREHWPETVSRYFNFMAKHLYKNHNYSIPPETFNRLEQGVRDLEFLPSMRGLMTAGPAAERNHLCFYNCSFLPIDNQVAFDEIMFILLCGTGVGFSVERHHIGKLPEIPEKIYDSDTTIVVSDSKEGWAKALRQLIALLYSGEAPKWDLSKVRPAGARLKTFGGRCSGPDVLGDLFRFVVNIFKNAQGRKLTSLECHDIACKIGEIVVVGGVRRSALISLSDLEDNELRYAKSGRWWEREPQRALANNSAVYKQKPKSKQFLQEMLALIESESGERGIFNREGVRKSFERIGRELTNLTSVATNPCQPGWATVLTPEGVSTMKDLKVGDTIWSGSQWTKVVNKVWTGVKPVYAYETSAGVFNGTDNHRVVQCGEKIEVRDARSVDSCLPPHRIMQGNVDSEYVVAGLLLGDGMYHEASRNILLCVGSKDTDYFIEEGVKDSIVKPYKAGHNTYKVNNSLIKREDVPRTYMRDLPSWIYSSTVDQQLSFLRGLYSANGSLCGGRITLKQSSYTLVRSVQLLLNSLGVFSYLTVNKPNETKFRNGYYLCKQSYDLNIGRHADKKFFADNIGFIQRYKQEKLTSMLSKRNTNTAPRKVTFEITNVISLPEEEVFDITVDAPEHTYWTGGLLVSNCGEILLNPHQLCNLSTVVVRPEDSLPELEEKIKCAAILGTYQASMTNFKYLRSNWKKQTAEEALLGVSMTGICDHPVIGQVSEESAHWLQVLRQAAVDTNREVAALLGINPAAAVTCIKPEGTVSQLANTSSGMHPNFARHYLRTYRSDNKDPLTAYLKEKGVYSEPAFTQESTTTVFYFPVKAPDQAVLREHMTALDQLRLWLHYKKNYTQHNPSVTIFVKDHEWPEVISWVYDNFDDIVGVSFLPYSDHSYQQAPFQEITEEQYREWVARTPEEIDWEGLVELSDNVQGVQTLSCTSGQCEL